MAVTKFPKKVTPDLERLGFTKASAPVQRRIIMSIEGLEKSGKSHMALTAPGPIAVVNTDIGLEGVVQKFQMKKDIMMSDYALEFHGKPAAVVISEADDVWKELSRAYHGALASKDIRTVVVDTGTEAWEMLRLASFGQLSQVMPHMYGPVNAEYRAMIRAAYDSDKNVIFVHKLKPKWITGADGKGQKTGEYERAGFADTGFMVQINARVWREEDEDRTFHLTVLDCRHNPQMAGEDFVPPMNEFPFIAASMVPNTTPDDWM